MIENENLRLEQIKTNNKVLKKLGFKLNSSSSEKIVEEKGLKQVTDTGAIEAIIDKVIADNPDNTAAYRAGKTALMGWFVGQVMKASKGKANPTQVNQMLRAKLA